jgi:hypothetical protein
MEYIIRQIEQENNNGEKVQGPILKRTVEPEIPDLEPI